MGNTLATMLTMTTYGTWLRGDQRGWVDDGKMLSADPERESADRARMKHPMYVFPRGRLLEVGTFIGKSHSSLASAFRSTPFTLVHGMFTW